MNNRLLIPLLISLILLLHSCSSPYHRPPLVVSQKRVKKPLPKELIVIDAGHGGEDFGTRSLEPPRHLEKHLNLSTAYMVKEFLRQLNYRVLMTRREDVFVSLEQRAEMANHAEAALFVSIHYNAAPNVQAKGVEVYYYRCKEKTRRTKQSKALANSVLCRILQHSQAKSRGVKHGNFAVIRETTMPAILVEGGFLTNDEEMSLLKDSDYRKRIAWGVAEGIHQYLSKENV